VVTTASDPQGRPTVFALLDGVNAHLVPVGRLDLATSGLLLLTNDTRLANWLTDPRSAVPRVYLVTARGRVTEGDLTRLTVGLDCDGDHLVASHARVAKASSRESHVVLTLTEGQNREVRRLFDAIGHEVTRLRRVQVGGLEIGALAPGCWRVVDAAELSRVFPAYRQGRRGGAGQRPG
jgi:23S rRNA pseudouridine2605 synthase